MKMKQQSKKMYFRRLHLNLNKQVGIVKDSKGFIKLDRSIFEHWIFQDAEKFKAFVDLIQLARWKDEKMLIGNEVVIVPRGSYYTSELKLADRWGWGRDKTRNFLSLLEKERMIKHLMQ